MESPAQDKATLFMLDLLNELVVWMCVALWTTKLLLVKCGFGQDFSKGWDLMLTTVTFRRFSHVFVCESELEK